MSTSRPPRVLITVAGLLLWSCLAVTAQKEDEAVSNSLSAVDIIRLGDPDDDMIVGTAGNDYPTYAEIPNTAFSCREQGLPGYYADQETQCQVFHICVTQGRRLEQFSFLCPNGTIFNQQYLVCVWWYDFNCATAPSLYSINANIYSDTGLSSSQPNNFGVGAQGTAAASAPRGTPVGTGSQGGLSSAGREGTAGGFSTPIGRPGATGSLSPSTSGLSAGGQPFTSGGRPGTINGLGSGEPFTTTAGRPGTAGSGVTGGQGATGRFPTTGGLTSVNKPGTSGGFSSTSGTGTLEGLTSAGGPGTVGGLISAGRPGTAGGFVSEGGPGPTGGFASADRPSTTGGFTSLGRPGTTGDITQAGRPETTGGFTSAGRPGATGGFSSAGRPGATGGFSSAGTLGATGGFSSAGTPGVTGGFSSAGRPGATGGFFSAGSPGATGGFSSAGSPGATGGFSSADRPGTTGGFSSAGRPGATGGFNSADGLGIAGGFTSVGKPAETGEYTSAGEPDTTGRFPVAGGLVTSGESGGVSLPSTGTNQVGGVPLPATGTTQVGGVPLPATGTTQVGGVLLPATGTTQVGGVPLPATGTNQESGVSFPATGTTQVGGVPLPATGTNQEGGVSLPGIGTNQEGGVPLPATGTNQEGGVSFPATGTTQVVGVPLSATGANQEGGVSLPGIETNQEGGVPLPAIGTNQEGGVSLPGIGTNQIGGIPLPATETTQVGGVSFPATGTTQVGGVSNQFGGFSTSGVSGSVGGVSERLLGPGLTEGIQASKYGLDSDSKAPSSAGGFGGTTEQSISTAGFPTLTLTSDLSDSTTGLVSAGVSTPGAFGTGVDIRSGSGDEQGGINQMIKNTGSNASGRPQSVTGYTYDSPSTSNAGFNFPGQNVIGQGGQLQDAFSQGENGLGLNQNISPSSLGASGIGQIDSNRPQTQGQFITGQGQAELSYDQGQSDVGQGQDQFGQGQIGQTDFTQGQGFGGILQEQGGIQLQVGHNQNQIGLGQNYGNQVGNVQGQGGFTQGHTELGQGQIGVVQGQSQGGQGQSQLSQGQGTFTQGQVQGQGVLAQNDYATGPINQKPIQSQGSGYSYPAPATSLIPGSGISISSGMQGNGQENIIQSIQKQESNIPTQNNNYQDNYNTQGPGLAGSQSTGSNINNNPHALSGQGNVAPQAIQGTIDSQRPQITGSFNIANNNGGNEIILISDDNISGDVQFQSNQDQTIQNTGSNVSGRPQSVTGYTYDSPSSNNLGQNTFSGNINTFQRQTVTSNSPGQFSGMAGTDFTSNPSSGSNNIGHGGVSTKNEFSSPKQSFTLVQAVSNPQTQSVSQISTNGVGSQGNNLGNSNNFVTNSATGNVNAPIDITQQLQYIPPSKEFTPSGSFSSQKNMPTVSQHQQNEIFVTNTFSTSPVSLTNSLKQEVVAPVKQAGSTFTFPIPQNSLPAVDISALQQGYLPPANEFSQNTGNNFASSSPGFSSPVKFPSSSSPSFNLPGSSSSSTTSSQGSLGSLSLGSPAYPSSNQGSSLGSTSNLLPLDSSANPSAGFSLTSSSGYPQSSPSLGLQSSSLQGSNINSQSFASSLPVAPASSTTGLSNANVGGNTHQNLPPLLEQGYLPPVADSTRNVRQASPGKRMIFVTPLPKEDSKQSGSNRQSIARRAFRPSQQITDSSQNTFKFVPKLPSKPFGRIFFQSNRRSDGVPIRYVDNSRRSFVATSSSSFNPYNKYNLSWRS